MKLRIIQATDQFNFESFSEDMIKDGYTPLSETFKVMAVGDSIFGRKMFFTMLFQKK